MPYPFSIVVKKGLEFNDVRMANDTHDLELAILFEHKMSDENVDQFGDNHV